MNQRAVFYSNNNSGCSRSNSRYENRSITPPFNESKHAGYYFSQQLFGLVHEGLLPRVWLRPVTLLHSHLLTFSSLQLARLQAPNDLMKKSRLEISGLILNPTTYINNLLRTPKRPNTNTGRRWRPAEQIKKRKRKKKQEQQEFCGFSCC